MVFFSIKFPLALLPDDAVVVAEPFKTIPAKLEVVAVVLVKIVHFLIMLHPFCST